MTEIPFNRTKIIATIGPACDSYEKLLELAEAGMDVCRLNFSHAEYDTILKILQHIHKINENDAFNIAILADLQGPKLRVGKMPEGGISLKAENTILITNQEIIGTEEKFTLRYPHLAEDLIPGVKILLDDGKLEVLIEESINEHEVKAKILRGGILKSKKGFNIPGAKLSLPALTEKDKKDLEFILTQDIDWVALSFVRSANDVKQLRERISKEGKELRIIAKIEKPEAVDDIDNIISAADGIMVARGDLGIEMPLQAVPVIQKNIIQSCIFAAKPVIVATQMMESMMENTIPNRAEVSDVANAVIDGADAVMLSGETSVGKHPVLTVATMDKIINDVEKDHRPFYRGTKPGKDSTTFIADEVCYTAARISYHLDANGIVVMTQSGSSARKIASYRPHSSLFVFSENTKLLRCLALMWGIRTFYYSDYKSTDQTISDTNRILIKAGLINKGDMLIHTASMPIENRGRANTVRISTIE
ncbi:MAG: pyruvate kinase [Bacteroidales bacterium]|nr:pyruvate kinase [Bacteroidales bacterium]